MKLSIFKSQVVLFVSHVLFAAHTLAVLPEEARAEIIARRRQQQEAGLAARDISSLNLQSEAIITLGEDETLGLIYSSNWAGAVQTSPPSGTFETAYGQWALPTVSQPPSASGPGTWYSAEWVGIDGYSCPTAILQAGTISYVTVDASGGVTTGAEVWYEWYPASAISLPNFSVDAGDNIKVSIRATSNLTGEVTIQNLSMGQSTSINVSAPDSTATLCGSSAEWILEDFSSGGLVPFSAFTNVYFKHCVATTTGGDRIGLDGSTLIDIYQSNKVLASAVQVSSSELEVYYG
jgi:hypothetical protein